MKKSEARRKLRIFSTRRATEKGFPVADENNQFTMCFKWGVRITLGLNAAKNISFMEKCLKRKLFRMKFSTKKSVVACLYLP